MPKASQKTSKKKKKVVERFATYSDDKFEDIREDQKKKNTLKADRKTEKVFIEYLQANHSDKVQHYEYWRYEPELLDQISTKYWFEVRQQNGERYNINSLRGLRYGLNRNLQRRRIKLDLLKSDCFTNCQRSFQDATRQLKQLGLAVGKHYDEIKPAGNKSTITSIKLL